MSLRPRGDSVITCLGLKNISLFRLENSQTALTLGEQILVRKIYDVIKQNESELANTVFKIQPNKSDFFCFLLFVKSFNCFYLWNQLPNLCGIFTKLKPNNTLIVDAKKPKITFSTPDSFCLITSHVYIWCFL